MPELIKTFEVVGNVAEKIYRVGQFVVDRFQGGYWGTLATGVQPEKPANIQVHESQPELPIDYGD